MVLKLSAYQCVGCESRSLLAPGYCPHCREKNELVLVEVDGIGEIITYTVVRVGDPRFASETPYPLAIIELNGKLRVLGRIKQANPSTLQIGMNVILTEFEDKVPVFSVIQK